MVSLMAPAVLLPDTRQSRNSTVSFRTGAARMHARVFSARASRTLFLYIYIYSRRLKKYFYLTRIARSVKICERTEDKILKKKGIHSSTFSIKIGGQKFDYNAIRKCACNFFFSSINEYTLFMCFNLKFLKS